MKTYEHKHVIFFSCNSFYATSEILTPDGICEEFKSCQEQQIEVQKECHELHKHNSFIVMGFDNANDCVIVQLKKAIIDLLDRYLEITKKCDMQITSSIKRYNVGLLDKGSIIEFFQNAYISNHGISNKYKTHPQIFEKYKYKIHHAINNIVDLKKIVDTHYRRRKIHGQNKIKNSNGNLFSNRLLIFY